MTTILNFDDVMKVAQNNSKTYSIDRVKAHGQNGTTINRVTKNETRMLLYGENKTQPSMLRIYTNGRMYVDEYGSRYVNIDSTGKNYKIPKKFKNTEHFIKFWRKMLTKLK